MTELIHRERRGPVLLATIDRPKANALNGALLEELDALLTEVEAQEALRALVLTGAGRCFVAGADIGEMAELGPLQARTFSEKGQRILARIAGLPKLVVAAVNGHALGGGCELMLACDLAWASEQATFGQPEVKLGVIPGFGGTQRLARLVGPRVALELCTTARTLGPAEAKALGLVQAVLPAEGFVDAVLEALRPALEQAPLAVVAAKQAIHRGLDLPLERALQLESEMFGALFASVDQKEGMKAFLEKRAPGFTGR